MGNLCTRSNVQIGYIPSLQPLPVFSLTYKGTLPLGFLNCPNGYKEYCTNSSECNYSARCVHVCVSASQVHVALLTCLRSNRQKRPSGCENITASSLAI